jgi:5-(carboxyamino)imidazole ribonucleotide mutase
MRMTNEFKAQMLSDLSMLKTQITNLMGDLTGGRIADLERRMERHEQNWQRAKGFLAAAKRGPCGRRSGLRAVAAALIRPACGIAHNRIINRMIEQPLVGVVMGSKSDYEVLVAAVEILRAVEIPHEARIVSAHRTPDLLFEYAETARGRGLRVIIAGAGGAAHLPGMLAAKTLVPVLGVPVPATHLNGLDSLLSIVQMPKGVPVGTLAIGRPGAANAALLAAEILAATDQALYDRLAVWRETRTRDVLEQSLDEELPG